jgi:hypothetical protein
MIARVPWVPFAPTLKGKMNEIIIVIITISTVIISSEKQQSTSGLPK